MRQVIGFIFIRYLPYFLLNNFLECVFSKIKKLNKEEVKKGKSGCPDSLNLSEKTLRAVTFDQ
jgi:hypothetical protein